jgi:predicted amidohydrolase
MSNPTRPRSLSKVLLTASLPTLLLLGSHGSSGPVLVGSASADEEAGATKLVPLVVATVTMNAHADKAVNRELFARYMREAAEKGAHLVVFPENALQQNPGWGLDSYTPTPEEVAAVHSTAEPIPGESTAWLTERAKALGIHVVFGMTERGEDGKFYNVSVFLGPEGILARYRKRSLWDWMWSGNEPSFWTQAEGPDVVVDSPLGKVGLLICHEMGHGGRGWARALGAAGARLLVTVSAWPEQVKSYRAFEMYETESIQAARECNCWHAIANQTGQVGQAVDYGHSRIVDPSGTVIADTGRNEGIAIARTDILVNPAGLPIPGGR